MYNITSPARNRIYIYRRQPYGVARKGDKYLNCEHTLELTSQSKSVILYDLELRQPTCLALDMPNQSGNHGEFLRASRVRAFKFFRVVCWGAQVGVQTRKSFELTMTDVAFVRFSVEGEFGC